MKQHGYTVIEVIVAFAIAILVLGSMMLFGIGVQHTYHTLKDKSQEQYDKDQHLREVIREELIPYEQYVTGLEARVKELEKQND